MLLKDVLSATYSSSFPVVSLVKVNNGRLTCWLELSSNGHDTLPNRKNQIDAHRYNETDAHKNQQFSRQIYVRLLNIYTNELNKLAGCTEMHEPRALLVAKEQELHQLRQQAYQQLEQRVRQPGFCTLTHFEPCN